MFTSFHGCVREHVAAVEIKLWLEDTCTEKSSWLASSGFISRIIRSSVRKVVLLPRGTPTVITYYPALRVMVNIVVYPLG
jgi:hypothetical protein